MVTLLSTLALSMPARASDAPSVAWSELEYKASKFGFTLRARVALDRLSPPEVDWALVQPAPGDWFPPPDDGGWLLRLVSDGLGGHSTLELLIDDEGSSLQRVQKQTGRRLKDHRFRTQRFAASSIHIGTVRPIAAEKDRPFEEWSDSSVWVHALPEEAQGLPIGQPSGLFYTLATADLAEPGDRETVYLFSKGRVMRVELVAEAWVSVSVDHDLEDQTGSRRRSGSSTVLEVSIDGTDIEGGDSSDFRFLSLRDNVRVYLDSQTRVPVLITGRLGVVGQARIELERVRLR